jgi:peptide deformylase
MIYPIIIYGDPVLRKQTAEITSDYPELKKLIADMFETMYAANGVGLAAPQIGKAVRLFVIDSSRMEDDEDPGFKKAFINAEIIEESEEEWKFEEGCLSIPGIREKVDRPEEIRIRYMDEDMIARDDVFNGIAARIIQHEYDHIEGVLFTDHLTAFKKNLIKGKLTALSKGEVDVTYAYKVFSSRKR